MLLPRIFCSKIVDEVGKWIKKHLPFWRITFWGIVLLRFKLLCYYRWFFAAFNVNLQIVEEVGNRRIKNSSFPTFPSLFCATKTEFFIQTKFENKILKVNNFGMKALLALWDCSIVILWQQFVVWCTDAFSLFMEDWFSRTQYKQNRQKPFLVILSIIREI